MTRQIPVVSGKQMVKALQKVGYSVLRQRGSHIRLTHPSRRKVTVPNHKELGVGLTARILSDAELSVAEFKKLIR